MSRRVLIIEAGPWKLHSRFGFPGLSRAAQQSRRLIAREDAGVTTVAAVNPSQTDGSGCAKIGIVQVSVCPPDDRLKLKYLGRYELGLASSFFLSLFCADVSSVPSLQRTLRFARCWQQFSVSFRGFREFMLLLNFLSLISGRIFRTERILDGLFLSFLIFGLLHFFSEYQNSRKESLNAFR